MTHPTESAEQSALIDWWHHYSRTKGLDERLLFAIPNGANKSIQQAMKFKREGLRKGVPDLMLAMQRQRLGQTLFAGLFIEMKRVGEKARPEQIEYGMLLRSMGYHAMICAGADEAMQAIKGYVER